MSFAALTVPVTLRIVRHGLPGATRASACICAAPASLLLVGYLAVTETPNTVAVTVFLAVAQALYFGALAQEPACVKAGFHPSHAAMTFPFVVATTALSSGMSFLSPAGMALPPALFALSAVENALACAMTELVLFKYVRFLSERSINRV